MAAPLSSRPRRALLTTLVVLAALLLLPSLAGASVQYVSVKAKDTGVARDGVLGPGDTVDASVTVTNDDPAHAVANLTATATSSTPGVTVTDGSSVFPAAPAGATVQALDPITVKLGDGWTCGDVVHLTLTLVADGVRSTVDVPVPTGVAGPHQEYRTTAVVSVPDGGTGESAVDVPAGLARDVRVRVRDLQAPAIGDVELTLVPPHGAPVVLLPGPPDHGLGAVGHPLRDQRRLDPGRERALHRHLRRPGARGPRRHGGGRALEAAGQGHRRRRRRPGPVGLVARARAVDVRRAGRRPRHREHRDRRPRPGRALRRLGLDRAGPGRDADLRLEGRRRRRRRDGPPARRSWPAKGRHRVSVTVSDGNGDATDEADVAVTVPPVAAHGRSAVGPALLRRGHARRDRVSDPDGTVATYAWDLDGDGRYDHADTAPTWSTLAPTAGTYTVRLKVTDDLGASAVTTRSLTVANRPPTAALTGPQPAIRGEAATLDASGSADLDGTSRVRLDLRRRWDRHDHHADHHARLRGERHAHGEGQGHRRRRRDRGGHAAAQGDPAPGRRAHRRPAQRPPRRPDLAECRRQRRPRRRAADVRLELHRCGDVRRRAQHERPHDGHVPDLRHEAGHGLRDRRRRRGRDAYATVAIVNDPPVASFTATPDHVAPARS